MSPARRPRLLAAFALLALGAAGCTLLTRTPTQYRDDTAAVLAQAEGDIKACYDAALATSATAQGTVMVQLAVDQDTGKIGEVKADDKGTTAPAELAECVTKAIDGLTLSPPDAREGRATFVYQFEIAPPPKPPPSAPPPAPPSEPAPTPPAEPTGSDAI